MFRRGALVLILVMSLFMFSYNVNAPGGDCSDTCVLNADNAAGISEDGGGRFVGNAGGADSYCQQNVDGKRYIDRNVENQNDRITCSFTDQYGTDHGFCCVNVEFNDAQVALDAPLYNGRGGAGGEINIDYELGYPRDVCVNAGENLMQIRITNRGGNTVTVRVLDKLYKEGNEEALNDFDDSASIESNSRNTFSYYFDFTEEGDYYHDILIYTNNRAQFSFVDGLTTIKNAEEEGCCVEEGYAPEENELCCDGMPEDGVGGRCGCPSGLNWFEEAEVPSCVPDSQQLCYSSDADERRDQFLACSFRWFTQQWWGDWNNEGLVDCFFQRNVNENPIQVCCPYIEYDGKEYGEFRDIVVY